MYAMGWTQHTHGTQNIRAATIIQSLLGNMGMAGGGINALRGESNVQGSTDHGLLFHILPGYLAAPRAKFQALADYIDANTPKCSDPLSANWWQNFNKYAVSLLKAMYGDNATADNEFGYGWLPKLADSGNYSWLTFWPNIINGAIKGLLAWGQNPAVSSTNANWVRDSMDKLEWLVTVNLWDTETSSFAPASIRLPFRLRSSCCPARPRWKKRAASATAAVGRSGATRPSSRRARPKPMPGLSTNSCCGCASCTPTIPAPTPTRSSR
jgi:formate dehydrogenase major subunit